jgi:hypothetical protein
LDLKKRLGYDDVRFHRGENCDLCGNNTFGRGYAEGREEACDCGCNGKCSTASNGHASISPDFESLVEAVTNQVMKVMAGRN